MAQDGGRMTEGRGTLKAAALAAVGYIAIMAVGMFTSGHLFGFTYGDPDMMYVMIFFEVILSLYAFLMARRLFKQWDCGFRPIDWSGMVWLIPNFMLIAALFVALFRTGTIEFSGLALIVIVTMILVGFSEELMFRGVAFRGALNEVSPGKAIVISSVLFSLLHSVNVLAFVPLDGMVEQLGLTFVFGLAMACYALRVNSFIPLMIFHALWDMVQFLGGLYGADFGPLITIGIVLNAVVAAALWWFVLRKRAVVGGRSVVGAA